MAPRSEFFPLVVARVDQLTDDAAAVTFDVPPPLRSTFAFAAGQSLTVRRRIGEREERRSYSICAPVGRAPRIGVRVVEGGVMSAWLAREVRSGDVIEAQAPAGNFVPDLTVPGRHVLIAAGSGITPILSIAASLLAAQAESTVTLVYGNRRSDTVMFADEVADLKDSFPARVHVVHVLSRESLDVELFSGRLDPTRLRRLLPLTIDVPAIDEWWLCGPFELVTGAIEVLAELGVERERVHRELFYVEPEPPAEVHHHEDVMSTGVEVTVILDGRRSTLTIGRETPVLDGAQRTRPDLPFACKGGVCGTCRALVVHGVARMRRNYALEPDELAAGYVLTCQALAVTDELTVDYDS
ncbi:MAG: phenylacetate-CoA oxygenase/reductase subunit PaaK [Actinobacteria bacterium]|nr:phenylacetate-CoA oxygenase/reductase subunit PaaK [Actinomycetota bacterium]